MASRKSSSTSASKCVPARSWSVVAGDANLVGRRSYDIARMGIKYVPQDKKVFSDLTVRENLELGSYATQDYNWDRVTDYFPKLKELMDRKGGYLSEIG